MSVKLTDAQLVMMSAAAQREDRCLAAPETMKGAVVNKAGAKLVKLGFAREIRAKPGVPLWRRDETGRSFALKLTAAGLSHRRRRGTAGRDQARRGVASASS